MSAADAQCSAVSKETGDADADADKKAPHQSADSGAAPAAPAAPTAGSSDVTGADVQRAGDSSEAPPGAPATLPHVDPDKKDVLHSDAPPVVFVRTPASGGYPLGGRLHREYGGIRAGGAWGSRGRRGWRGRLAAARRRGVGGRGRVRLLAGAARLRAQGVRCAVAAAGAHRRHHRPLHLRANREAVCDKPFGDVRVFFCGLPGDIRSAAVLRRHAQATPVQPHPPQHLHAVVRVYAGHGVCFPHHVHGVHGGRHNHHHHAAHHPGGHLLQEEQFNTTRIAVDLTGCGSLLCVLGVGVMIFGFVLVLVFLVWGASSLLIAVYAGLVGIVFSLYLMLDTQLIMGGRHMQLTEDEHVFATLMLYVDIADLFWSLLSTLAYCCGE